LESLGGIVLPLRLQRLSHNASAFARRSVSDGDGRMAVARERDVNAKKRRARKSILMV